MMCSAGLAISCHRVYYPVICRRERSHPGAQLSLFGTHAG